MISPITQTQRCPATTSASYGFVSTERILSVLESQGWLLHQQSIAKTSKPERQGYQRHLIKLVHPAFSQIDGLSINNKSVPQLCLVNSHDGRASLQGRLGIYRIACANGLMVGTDFASFRVVHSEALIKDLLNKVDAFIAGIPKALDNVRALQGRTIDLNTETALIQTIYNERLKNVKEVHSVDYNARPRRTADTHRDAYTVLNRIQEYVIRGGIKYQYWKPVLNNDGVQIGRTVAHTTTRPVSSIDASMKLNAFVFNTFLKEVA